MKENGFEVQVEKMKIISALNMNWEEYKDVVEKATDGKSTLMSEVGGWDYVCDNGYEYSVEEIHELVGKHLGINISEVIIDISNDDNCVVIIINENTEKKTIELTKEEAIEKLERNPKEVKVEVMD